jgi:hypothetical protein
MLHYRPVGRVLHGARGMRLRRHYAGFTGRVLHGAHGMSWRRPSACFTGPERVGIHSKEEDAVQKSREGRTQRRFLVSTVL